MNRSVNHNLTCKA